MVLENRLEEIDKEIKENPKPLSITDKVKYTIIKWAIDTSAKTGSYAPLMGTVEAYIGLDFDQILQSRANAALIDAGLARTYTKAADYLGKKFDVNIKDNNLKAWSLDASAMIVTHAPVYAGILAAAGADMKQIVSASLIGDAIGVSTSKPFRKYVLAPWRNYLDYKKYMY